MTVENGVPVIRCANNGLTCWINRAVAVEHEPDMRREIVDGPVGHRLGRRANVSLAPDAVVANRVARDHGEVAKPDRAPATSANSTSRRFVGLMGSLAIAEDPGRAVHHQDETEGEGDEEASS